MHKLRLFFAVLILASMFAFCLLPVVAMNAVENTGGSREMKVPPPRLNLAQIAREAMAIHFHQSKFSSLSQYADSLPVCDEFKHPAGLFVTLSKHGETRACWGAIAPLNRDLVRGTIYTTEAALTKEYRFPRIRASEWQTLKPQVTVIRAIEPIASSSGQDPMRFGLMVRSGGKGAVLLPGEASDPHYQLVKCKLKAGISSQQPCQLYRIRADVFK